MKAAVAAMVKRILIVELGIKLRWYYVVERWSRKTSEIGKDRCISVSECVVRKERSAGQAWDSILYGKVSVPLPREAPCMHLDGCIR